MSEPLPRILGAQSPLTLAGVPTGFLPWLAGDLARAAHGAGGTKSKRAVVVVADELAMRALADTVPVFAPEVSVQSLPAWDCLPYDRSSPALRVMAERLATLHALQVPRKGPQLLIVTANAATQRVLTPFRIRQLTRRLALGERIDAVADAGEYAVRGSRSICIQRVSRVRSGSISSATRSRASAGSILPTSAPPDRRKPSR